ncbi:reverse transcriptase domain-containing protein, partial [Tanacetum coccineum]
MSMATTTTATTLPEPPPLTGTPQGTPAATPNTEETPATRIPPNAPRRPTNFVTEEVPETNEVRNPDFSWEEFTAKYRDNLAPFITPRRSRIPGEQARSIEGFEELRKAFRRNFTQRKKYSKNPVELARIRQRSGESLDSFTERFKDEMVYFKHCPDLMKISTYMNGINNKDLIKKLNDKVLQTFDELMRRVRAFIRAEDAVADSRRGYSGYRAPDQPKKQFNEREGHPTPVIRA